MTNKTWMFAVDYHLFGETHMRHGLVESAFINAGEKYIARLVEEKYQHPDDYVSVYQYVLQGEPRSSYNRRL